MEAQRVKTIKSLAAGESWMQLQKGWPASQSRCDVCPLCCQTTGRAAACLRTYQVGLLCELQSVSTCLLDRVKDFASMCTPCQQDTDRAPSCLSTCQVGLTM